MRNKMNREITQTLCEVAEIIMGQSPESESYNDKGAGIPFYQGKSDFGEVYPTVRMYCTSPKKIAMADDILMSVRAPIGDVNIAQEKCCIGRGLAAIRPKAKTNLKYLFYLLDYYKERLAEQGTGSTFKAISKDVLNELRIPIWPLEKQKWIADVIDEIQTMIFNRKEALSVLDELVKSRFIEMFGDPVMNPMGWEVKKLKDLSLKISDGVHAKPNYTEDGKPFISVVNITTGHIDFSNCKFVSQEDYEKMIKSTHPEKGDVLYTKVGATYGIPAYVDTDEDFCLYVSVCLIKPKHELVNARFLTESMRLPYIKHQADRRIRGIGVPDLHLNQIREFDLVCPPLDLQERYMEFVDLVDKSKLAVQQSIETLQTLKAKLMQEYFG